MKVVLVLIVACYILEVTCVPKPFFKTKQTNGMPNNGPTFSDECTKEANIFNEDTCYKCEDNQIRTPPSCDMLDSLRENSCISTCPQCVFDTLSTWMNCDWIPSKRHPARKIQDPDGHGNSTQNNFRKKKSPEKIIMTKYLNC